MTAKRDVSWKGIRDKPIYNQVGMQLVEAIISLQLY